MGLKYGSFGCECRFLEVGCASEGILCIHLDIVNVVDACGVHWK